MTTAATSRQRVRKIDGPVRDRDGGANFAGPCDQQERSRRAKISRTVSRRVHGPATVAGPSFLVQRWGHRGTAVSDILAKTMVVPIRHHDAGANGAGKFPGPLTRARGWKIFTPVNSGRQTFQSGTLLAELWGEATVVANCRNRAA